MIEKDNVKRIGVAKQVVIIDPNHHTIYHPQLFIHIMERMIIIILNNQWTIVLSLVSYHITHINSYLLVHHLKHLYHLQKQVQ